MVQQNLPPKSTRNTKIGMLKIKVKNQNTSLDQIRSGKKELGLQID